MICSLACYLTVFIISSWFLMVIYQAIGSPGHREMLLTNQIKLKQFLMSIIIKMYVTSDTMKKQYSDLCS